MHGYPFSKGYGYCMGGGHFAHLPELTTINRQRYCVEHMPEPDPETEPDPKPYVPTARDIGRMGFQKWRLQHGHFADDDHAEELSDADKARLSRHVLP